MSLLCAILQEDNKQQNNIKQDNNNIIIQTLSSDMKDKLVTQWRNNCNSLNHEINNSLRITYMNATQQKTLPAHAWVTRINHLINTGRGLLQDNYNNDPIKHTLHILFRRCNLVRAANIVRGTGLIRGVTFTKGTTIFGKSDKGKHLDLGDTMRLLEESTDGEELDRTIASIVNGRLNRYLNSLSEYFKNILSYSSVPHLIKIEIDVSDPERLQEVMNNLACSQRITVELAEFANFLTERVFPSLISECCDIDAKRDPRKLSLSIYHQKNIIENVPKMVENIITFFDHIQGTIDCRWEDDRTLFSILGRLVGKDFFELLKIELNEKLSLDPDDENHPYDKDLSAISKLVTYLCEICFVEEKNSPWSHFKLDSTKAIQKYVTRHFLYEIRCLVECNLRENIVRIKREDQDAKCYEQTKIISREQAGKRDIFASPHLFPECSISGSMSKFFQLIYDKLRRGNDANSNHDAMDVRRAIEIYYILTPQIHGETLESDPVDIALFYNNSFYLAHGIIGHPWKYSFDNKEYGDNISYLLGDLVQIIRVTAVFTFSSFIKLQRIFFKTTLTESEIKNLNAIKHVSQNSETAINTCLKRIEYLKKSWQPILPADMFRRTMSNLCNFFVGDLIDLLTNVKHRTLGECLTRELHNLFTTAQTKLSVYFQDSIEENNQYRNWQRFCELTYILSCPMFTIATRWNKEKGQLSKLFSQEEVKHFIRIIFPSGKQKSAVLNMIQ